MELKSTASFKDVDVDAMLEHTTFDDFMRGMYSSKVAQQPGTTKKATPDSKKTQFEQMWDSVMTNEAEEQLELGLEFEEKKENVEEGFEANVLQQRAIANVRERRRRLAQSQIFDGSERKKA